MIRIQFAAIALLLGPAQALAGDGSFGVPASGILPPPTQTAALTQPADLPRVPAAQRVSRSYDIPTIREPAADAGRSRPAFESARSVPPPAIRKRGQSRAKPHLTVDPYYLANVTRDVRTEPPRAIEQAPPAIYPQPFPQAAATRAAPDGTPCYQLRGLFTSPEHCR